MKRRAVRVRTRQDNGHRGEWRLARKVMEEREHRGAFPATHSQLLSAREVQRRLESPR